MLSAVAALPMGRAGIRLHGVTPLRALLSAGGPIGDIARDLLGPGVQPVRLILFDKTALTNWSLSWHQDRTICVGRGVRPLVDEARPASRRAALCDPGRHGDAARPS
ncbi:hypothetical protein NX02_10485 [Sphingomonas sanxanigenens DSM 19645 = NX02]|uniref:Uncharacterized protein n=1 Tax=Sphingomonas sanxanigenens DSM 19645 = NX02 TaxID=1123269 RepID=W0A798_9SPHN|nr:hypothetical protein NX02_10485 [Sphingomonas sanxanigenens DSM 19645 = NX02]